MFSISPDHVVAAAIFNRNNPIDEIKQFYEQMQPHRGTWSNDFSPFNKIFENHFYFTFDGKRHFLMVFNDLRTLTFVKLAYPERIVDVWIRK